MRAILALLAGVFLTLAPAFAQDRPAFAQDRFVLGHARLFSNDALGDGEDRWRSGSYMVSQLRGTAWNGSPGAFGDILEYRLRSEIISPANLQRQSPNDRRFAGVIGLGLHSHFALGRAEARLGGELVFTGPQTGVGAFQREVHELLNMSPPGVLGSQIGNRVFPTLSAEIGRSFALTDRVALRPFAEAQAGVENLLRVGGDLTIGTTWAGSLMVRDPVTGHRVEGITGTGGQGISLTLGGDVAHVADSRLLPRSGPTAPTDTRARLRAGLHWQGEKSDVFYGVTWLGKEFDSQSEEQLVGSLRLRLRF
jgi:hypothetical protein